jgi:hypothetical protein
MRNTHAHRTQPGNDTPHVYTWLMVNFADVLVRLYAHRGVGARLRIRIRFSAWQDDARERARRQSSKNAMVFNLEHDSE